MKHLPLVRTLLAGMILIFSAAAVQAQSCPTALTTAETQYNNGDFDYVIELLSGCLDRSAFNNDERREAYRLIGLSHIGKDREAEARQAVRALLDVAPNYQPNPELDPPPFTRMVNEERRSAPQTPGRTAASTASASSGGVSRLQVSLHVEAAMLTVEDVDGSDSGVGGRLGITYLVTPNVGIDAFGRIDNMESGDYTLTEFGLGVRYQFTTGSAFSPYIGAGGSHRSAEFSDGLFSFKMSGVGFTLFGGFQYAFSPAIAMDLHLGGTFGKLDHELIDPFSSTTSQAGLGIVWSPSW